MAMHLPRQSRFAHWCCWCWHQHRQHRGLHRCRGDRVSGGLTSSRARAFGPFLHRGSALPSFTQSQQTREHHADVSSAQWSSSSPAATTLHAHHHAPALCGRSRDQMLIDLSLLSSTSVGVRRRGHQALGCTHVAIHPTRLASTCGNVRWDAPVAKVKAVGQHNDTGSRTSACMTSLNCMLHELFMNHGWMMPIEQWLQCIECESNTLAWRMKSIVLNIRDY